MKIMVTGARGLLGQKLIRILEADPDVELIATGRSNSSPTSFRSQYRVADITDRDQVDDLISGVMPDVLIHTAAMTNVDQCEQDKEGCWKTNVTAVEYIVKACKKNNVHLQYISTDFVFDGSHGPLDESEKPNPVNYYGKSKLAAEELVMKSGIPWSIIRTVLVYGISDDMSRSNIILWVKGSVEQGKAIRVVNDQFRTPTLAEDLAMGCYLAAKKKATGIFHISGKDFLSPYEIALRTADFFNLDKNFISPTDSSSLQQPAMRPAKTGFIIEKARKELGYEPHSFAEGIAMLSEQMKQRT